LFSIENGLASCLQMNHREALICQNRRSASKAMLPLYTILASKCIAYKRQMRIHIARHSTVIRHTMYSS